MLNFATFGIFIYTYWNSKLMEHALRKHSALEMESTTPQHRRVPATLVSGLGSTQENAAKASAAMRMQRANMATVDLTA